MLHATEATRSSPRRTGAANARSPDNPRYPSLYQINTRVWLTELSRSLGRRGDPG